MTEAFAHPLAHTGVGKLTVTVVRSLESIGREAWNALWRNSDTPTVFSCYEWMDAWWRSCHEDRDLRIYAAWLEDRLVGLLPTAWPSEARIGVEPVVILGDEHADYAAILVDRALPQAIGVLLDAACRDLPSCGRLLLRDLRDDSACAAQLEIRARGRLDKWCLADVIPCPRASLDTGRAFELAGKESLRRHARKLARAGEVAVHHYRDAPSILPRLDAFFAQHVARWAESEWPSLFNKETNRAVYRALAETLGGTGRLVYTEVTLDGRPVACHFGFLSENDLVWYKPSFDPALAKMSPGEVLIQSLLLWAGDQRLAGLDFTRGGEAFKRRFADEERQDLTYAYFASRTTALLHRLKMLIRHLRMRLGPGR